MSRAPDYYAPSGKYPYSRWYCQCSCGNKNKKMVFANVLKRGNTLSCGCLRKENAKELSKRCKSQNEFKIMNDYVIGYDSHQNEFYVDIDDFDKIKNNCWHKRKDDYFSARVNGKILLLHRVIMSCKDNEFVDYIHGIESRYDNRKNNLRIATRSQNNMNIRLKCNNTSGTTGVSWNNRDSNWIAYIGVDCQNIVLGYFNNYNEAVVARKEAENKYFGEWSYDYSQQMEEK